MITQDTKTKIVNQLFEKNFLLSNLLLLNGCNNSNITRMNEINSNTTSRDTTYKTHNLILKDSISKHIQKVNEIYKFLIGMHTPLHHLKHQPKDFSYKNLITKDFITSGYPINLYAYLYQFKHLQSANKHYTSINNNVLSTIKEIWDNFHKLYKDILALNGSNIASEVTLLLQELELCHAKNQIKIDNLNQKNKEIATHNQLYPQEETLYDIPWEIDPKHKLYNRLLHFNTSSMEEKSSNEPNLIYDKPTVGIHPTLSPGPSTSSSETTATVHDSYIIEHIYDQPPLQETKQLETTDVYDNKDPDSMNLSDPAIAREIIELSTSNVNKAAAAIIDSPPFIHKKSTEEIIEALQTIYCNIKVLAEIANCLQKKASSPKGQVQSYASIKHPLHELFKQRCETYELLLKLKTGAYVGNNKSKNKNEIKQEIYKSIIQAITSINNTTHLSAKEIQHIISKPIKSKHGIFVKLIKGITRKDKYIKQKNHPTIGNNDPIEGIQQAMQQDYHDLKTLLYALRDVPKAIDLQSNNKRVGTTYLYGVLPEDDDIQRLLNNPFPKDYN